MFSTVLQHPFYFSLFIAVIVTLSVDASRDLLDVSINGVTWTHLLNFPLWIVALVFATFAILRGIFNSNKLTMSLAYIRRARERHPLDVATELRNVRQRPRGVRINTNSDLFANLSPTRGITSATPASANTANARFV